MNVDKFQRSRLTFDLSAKVAHIGVPSIIHVLKHSLLRNHKPFELKFHKKTPYDTLVKIDRNCSGHMTKVAGIPIYNIKKNFLKSSSPEPEG